MTPREWLKPSECARRMGHRDAECVLQAIKKGDLPARKKQLTGHRARYLVHVDDFQRWFEDTWRPTPKAS